MLYEEKRFRAKENGIWSEKMTRYELILFLEKRAISKPMQWPYSIKIGNERTIKNPCGKTMKVRKEYPFAEENYIVENGLYLPYEPM